MNLTRRIALVVTTAALAAGCYDRTPPSSAPPASTGSRAPAARPERAFGGFMRGSLGDVSNFEGGTYVDVAEYGGASTVLLESAASDNAWWVNLTMNVTGNMADPAFAPGSSLEFDSARRGAGLWIDVSAHAGQRDGAASFSASARRVTVSVREGAAANHRRVVFSAYFTDASGAEQRVDGEYQYAVPVRVVESSAQLRGDMGQIRSFAGRAAVQTSPGYLRLDAEDTTARWWAMIGISMGEQGLGDPRLVPGAHFVLNGGYGGTGGLDDLGWQLIGCSGPSHGNYTFDTSSSHVEVDVRDGSAPGRREVTITAYFDGQRVDGVVEFEAN